MSLDHSIVLHHLPEAFRGGGDIFSDAFDIGSSGVLFVALRVPVRDLKTDENTDDDNHKVDRNCEPVVALHMLVETARNHGRRLYACVRRYRALMADLNTALRRDVDKGA